METEIKELCSHPMTEGLIRQGAMDCTLSQKTEGEIKLSL